MVGELLFASQVDGWWVCRIGRVGMELNQLLLNHSTHGCLGYECTRQTEALMLQSLPSSWVRQIENK